jgi:hypothetical protein
MKRSFPPRTTAKRSKSIGQQLNTYALTASAAGVGALALAQPAEAKIVYTPAHVQIPFCDTFNLDLNHDGISDFTFYACSSGHAGGMGLLTTSQANFIWGEKNSASALKPGFEIRPNKAHFQPKHGVMAFWGCNTSINHTCSSGGNWLNVKNRYLGFQFLIKGKVHYGWARLTVTFKQKITATLTGYAYETVPNKPIIAGKTKGLDNANIAEPNAALSIRDPKTATLGALALGAPGLSIWQREEPATKTQPSN